MVKKFFKTLLDKMISVGQLLFWDLWHIRILLINYTGNESNYGCIATSKSLVKLIRDKYPHCSIRFQSISYRESRLKIPFNESEIDSFLPMYILREKTNFRFFKWADIIILNGEGSIHEYKEPRFNQLCLGKLLQVYAAKMIYNKTVYAVNQTIDYNKTSFGGIISKCYGPLDYIAVREPNSLCKAQEIGLTKVKLSADAAFLLREGNNQNAEMLLRRKGLKDGFVCIFLSEIVSDFSPYKMIELIEKIKTRFKKDILIGVTTDTDELHLNEIKRHIPVSTIGMDVSPEDLIAFLKHADIVLSGRFHCCIFSFLANTPLCPFRSNTHKIEGLMKLMEYPVDVYDYGRDSNELIIDGIWKVISSADELRDRIKVSVSEAKALARLNIV